ncbi:MAG: hypothetical protein ACE5EW_07090, partial [Thermoplasmata archaeon]
MKTKAWIVGLALLAMAILPGLSGNAFAATQDVTTTWNVAQDTSFSVSFPAPHTGVDFDPASGTFTNLAATDQTRPAEPDRLKAPQGYGAGRPAAAQASQVASRVPDIDPFDGGQNRPAERVIIFDLWYKAGTEGPET